MSETVTPTSTLPTLCGCCARPLHEGDGIERGFESLLAVCDVLVYRALEIVGKRIGRRSHRATIQQANAKWHEVHTIVPASEDRLDIALEHVWEMVPAVLKEHGCCGVTPRLLEAVLDKYVRDLVAARMAHETSLLRITLDRHLSSDSGWLVQQ